MPKTTGEIWLLSIHVSAVESWSGEAGKLEASFNQFLSTTLQGEHDAELERVSQRGHTEREKYGDDTGSAVIEDLSEFGGHGHEHAHLQASDAEDYDDDDAYGDDVSFVSAMAAMPPLGPRDHLTWAPGVFGGNDRNASGDTASLVVALKSLDRTLQTHCKLLNRRIKKDKSNSNSTSPTHVHKDYKDFSDIRTRSPTLPKSQTRKDKVRSNVLMNSSYFWLTQNIAVGTLRNYYSFVIVNAGLQVVVLRC